MTKIGSTETSVRLFKGMKTNDRGMSFATFWINDGDQKIDVKISQDNQLKLKPFWKGTSNPDVFVIFDVNDYALSKPTGYRTFTVKSTGEQKTVPDVWLNSISFGDE